MTYDTQTAPLAEELTAEYGDVVPDALISRTVQAAWHAVPTHDGSAVAQLARTDVAAIADAVMRNSSAGTVTSRSGV